MSSQVPAPGPPFIPVAPVPVLFLTDPDPLRTGMSSCFGGNCYELNGSQDQESVLLLEGKVPRGAG